MSALHFATIEQAERYTLSILESTPASPALRVWRVGWWLYKRGHYATAKIAWRVAEALA